MYRRVVPTAAAITLILAVSAGPSFAGHDHYVVTPNGQCHQVARGQTAIDDKNHGGYHRFHANVHVGATEDEFNRVLGQGNAAVEVYKDRCPA